MKNYLQHAVHPCFHDTTYIGTWVAKRAIPSIEIIVHAQAMSNSMGHNLIKKFMKALEHDHPRPCKTLKE